MKIRVILFRICIRPLRWYCKRKIKKFWKELAEVQPMSPEVKKAIIYLFNAPPWALVYTIKKERKDE